MLNSTKPCISVSYSYLHYFMINIFKYDYNLYFEELSIQENFLYYYNDHLHTTFSKFININAFNFCILIAITQVTSLHSVIYVQTDYMLNNLGNICC